MLRLVAALIAAVVLTAAISIPSYSQQPPHTKAQSEAKPDNRGTKEVPLFVKTISEQKTQAELEKEEAKEQRAFNVETRMADLTGDLAGYTLALAIATGFLVLLTGGLLVLGFLQIRDAKASISAAVTAAKAAQEQVALGREEFISSNSPNIQLRGAFVANVDDNFRSGAIEVLYTLVNKGKSRARIVQSRVEVLYYTTSQLKLVPVSLGSNSVAISESVFAPLEAKNFSHRSNEIWDGKDLTPANFNAGLFFAGHIVYADDRGVTRDTAFYYKFDPVKRRFEFDLTATSFDLNF